MQDLAVPKTITEYINMQDEDLRPRLNEVYMAISSVLSDAVEKISWQMPTFWKGRNIIHFAAHKNHIGIYPGAEAVLHFADKLKDFNKSKGAIQLPHNKPLPLELIREIAAWCYINNSK